MSEIKKRRRGTAIVETTQGILVATGSSKVFLLPRGGANKGESRIEAAMKELREETGLKKDKRTSLVGYLNSSVNSRNGGSLWYGTKSLVSLVSQTVYRSPEQS